jgi:hypothetical protein
MKSAAVASCGCIVPGSEDIREVPNSASDNDVNAAEGIRNNMKQITQLAHGKLTARTGFILDVPEISRLLWKPKFQYGTVKIQGLPLHKYMFLFVNSQHVSAQTAIIR